MELPACRPDWCGRNPWSPPCHGCTRHTPRHRAGLVQNSLWYSYNVFIASIHIKLYIFIILHMYHSIRFHTTHSSPVSSNNQPIGSRPYGAEASSSHAKEFGQIKTLRQMFWSHFLHPGSTLTFHYITLHYICLHYIIIWLRYTMRTWHIWPQSPPDSFKKLVLDQSIVYHLLYL